MKKIHVVAALLLVAGFGLGASYDFNRPANPSQQIGFGAVCTAAATGSIAISSCDGAATVSGLRSCQIGTGTLTQDDSLQYRNRMIVDHDGALGVEIFGLMSIKYAWWQEDWMDAGYAPGGTSTNGPQEPELSGKFSEVENRAAWRVTVVDGDGDNAEVIKIADDEPNGVLSVTPNNKAGDSVSAQLNGEMFKMTDNYLSAFNCRWTATSTNNLVWMGVNLGDTTAPYTSLGTDYMGFWATNVGGNVLTVYFKSAKDSVATNLLCGTMAEGAYVNMSFGKTATALAVVYNGSAVALIPAANGTYCNNEPLSPVMFVQDTGTGQGKLKVDYIGTVQERQ